MNLQQQLASGKGLISRNPEIAQAIRITTLRESDPQNETQRLLAAAFFDLQEGKITKERFNELTGHLLIEPPTV